MATRAIDRASAKRRPPGDGTRILLVNKDPRDLSYYQALLQRAGCRVQASLSFVEGAQRVEREPYDLIFLDQGNSGFEGRNVLAKALEIDPELRVLVLARSHDESCCLEAMRSGALEYLEGHLSAAEIVALLETYIPRRPSASVASRPLAGGARFDKKYSSSSLSLF